MRWIWFLALVTWSSAFAQVDRGVQLSFDEFTKERSCYQVVLNSPSDKNGVALMSFPVSTRNDTSISFIHFFDSARDSVLNMFGPLSGESVFVRFTHSDKVVEFKPIVTQVELTEGYELAMIDGTQFVAEFLSSPSDIRVRISGADGNADFTISHPVIVALAGGFGAQCL